MMGDGVAFVPGRDAIRRSRGTRRVLDPERPFAVVVEPELSRRGRVEETATVFLVNRECPFTCLICDLWQYTLEESLRPGQILRQLDEALRQVGDARHIKLYNAGNFFDTSAIPREDRAGIATRLSGFETVIIENHPNLCGPDVAAFARDLNGHLEVAMGLETIHPQVLPRLNKQMTPDDFAKAAGRLKAWGVGVRAFVLLRPPYLTGEEGLEWAVRSTAFAFDSGADVCTVIPTRGGNGIMEQLESRGLFAPPSLDELERAQRACLKVTPTGRRLFVDLWDAASFSGCRECTPQRIEAMARANHTQRVGEPWSCRHEE